MPRLLIHIYVLDGETHSVTSLRSSYTNAIVAGSRYAYTPVVATARLAALDYPALVIGHFHAGKGGGDPTTLTLCIHIAWNDTQLPLR
ncbi:hypothetical protein LAZ67_18000902 [Cordylochernes scorpioides]|uniref:Uncharacterized protein n=1 Tax=Cordylochernes scorpioides TaxID=51811 RepID=A0ABY6LF95_9ARAC|nr:hypothetical protein LAZ67_18000902 [Cordylochernes scorpioides]